MGLINVLSTTKARLHTFLSGKTAKSGEVNGELNQIISAYNELLGDVSNFNNAMDTVTGGIDWTGETIADVKLISENAVTTSQNAEGISQNAETVAGNALSVANTANSTSNLAVSTAETAVSTASSALITSQEAELTANTVEEDYLAIKPTIEQAVIDAEAAAEAVAGKADKAYVDAVAANFTMGVVSPKSIVESMISDPLLEKIEAKPTFDVFSSQVIVSGADVETMAIPESLMYTTDKDRLLLYVGGLYQTLNVDYSVDTVNRTVTNLHHAESPWVDGYVVDFVVYKNITGITPADYFDGALILADSTPETAFSPAFRNKISGMVGDIQALDSALDTKAEFTSGTDIFLTGLTHTVTNAFITSSTFVNVIPTMEKAGEWSVESANGSFTITSDTAETSITFEWNAIKAGA
jgi:hypothetical protein